MTGPNVDVTMTGPDVDGAMIGPNVDDTVATVFMQHYGVRVVFNQHMIKSCVY
jgi:hypothetical protein